MIVEWLIGLALAPVDWLLGLVPESPAEAITFTMDDLVTPWITGLGELGAWVPWAQVVLAAPIVFACWALSFTLRVVRAILGHIPFVGGNG